MAAIKRWNGSAWEETYPKTTAGNIVATGTPSSTTFLSGTGVWATPEGTSNHSHGNINSSGQITSATQTVATGDYLIIRDVSNSSLISVGPVFGTSTTQFLTNAGTWATPTGGSGDVVGPASSVNARIATFNGTTGKLIQDSGTLISGLATSSHTHGNISSTGTISSTATIANGDRLIIGDAGTITQSSITFGTSTSQFLRNDGFFAVPNPLRDITNFTAPLSSNGTTAVALAIVETIAIGNTYAIEVSDDTTSTNNRMLLYWTQRTSSSTSAAAGMMFTFTARTVSTTTTITYKFVVYRSASTSFSIINAYTHTLGTGSSHPIATTTAIRVWRIFRVGG